MVLLTILVVENTLYDQFDLSSVVRNTFILSEFVFLFSLIITQSLLFKNILIFYQEMFERRIWLTVLWEEFNKLWGVLSSYLPWCYFIYLMKLLLCIFTSKNKYLFSILTSLFVRILFCLFLTIRFFGIHSFGVSNVSAECCMRWRRMRLYKWLFHG